METKPLLRNFVCGSPYSNVGLSAQQPPFPSHGTRVLLSVSHRKAGRNHLARLIFPRANEALAGSCPAKIATNANGCHSDVCVLVYRSRVSNARVFREIVRDRYVMTGVGRRTSSWCCLLV